MKTFASSLLQPILFIILAAFLRLVPHIPNFAPIGAMALFGGVYLNKKYALLIPLIAMILSDFFLGFSAATPFVYISFLLIGCLGLLLRKHMSFKNILLATLSGSLLFYLITNFGVWLVGNLYPHTLSGLVLCYTLALPFFRNTVLGDLFYVGLFFSAYAFGLSHMKGEQYANLYKKR